MNLEEPEQAYAIELVWNYLSQNSLWAKWIHCRQCMKRNFWIANFENNASYTWKLMLRLETLVVN